MIVFGMQDSRATTTQELNVVNAAKAYFRELNRSDAPLQELRSHKRLLDAIHALDEFERARKRTSSRPKPQAQKRNSRARRAAVDTRWPLSLLRGT